MRATMKPKQLTQFDYISTNIFEPSIDLLPHKLRGHDEDVLHA